MRSTQKEPWNILKAKVPHHPGVYIFKGSQNKVLYVGKAIDLYHRVSSYFSSTQDQKVLELRSRIEDLKTIVVESELEALILEANLIKKYLPLFNIKLTDDKDYLYIAITKEAFPKVITIRKQELTAVKKYWGPFPSSKTVKNTLKSLRKVFPWCTLTLQVFDPETQTRRGLALKRKRPCFYYHLGLCAGPCAGVIQQKEYQKIINRFAKFLDGKVTELISQLNKEMMDFSDQQKYEQAAQVKKVIEGIAYLTQANRTKLYLENPNFLEEENKLALQQLQKDLKLAELPERIEGYDISNIQGKEATGSMVVITDGEVDKSQYRKFKIRLTERPNDVGMMGEMLDRRFTHKEWKLPDLIIVDGGKPQVTTSKFKIENLKLKIPLFGLAKRMEWLYSPEGETIKLSKNSLSLKLLQKLRDEAHRFAITYHRKLRGKILLNENLT